MTRRRSLFGFGLVVAAALLLGRTPAAQVTGTVMPTPYQTVLDASGNPVASAKICTYTAGTTTAVLTYTDVGLSVANSNPIRADSAGRFVAYLTPGQSYKFVYQTASGTSGTCDGATFKTIDNVSAMPSTSGTVDVTGTAGESLTAGQCVYLSDGSGSKAAGQWFRCDTANAYSSALPQIGITPSAITSGATGTVRIHGSTTGLSSLSTGSAYYVSTAGAFTSTKPAAGRAVGYADSSTSLVLTGNPPPSFYTTGFVQEFRLSLTSGTSVTTTDVTAATTLYLTPHTGNRLTIFDSSGNPTTYTTAEISIAVPPSTSTIYDVFVYANSGVPTLELLAWTNDTTRATAVIKTTGHYTKSGDTTRLYVGSCRTTTVSGQAEDSTTKRYVWNYYNRVSRLLEKSIAGSTTWTYTTATIRQANGSTANQVEAVIGIPETPIDLTLHTFVSNASAASVQIGIGVDSTTSMASFGGFMTEPGGNSYFLVASYRAVPAVGKRTYSWNEWSQAAGTTTWNSSGLGANNAPGALSGSVQG